MSKIYDKIQEIMDREADLGLDKSDVDLMRQALVEIEQEK